MTEAGARASGEYHTLNILQTSGQMQDPRQCYQWASSQPLNIGRVVQCVVYFILYTGLGLFS